MASLDDLPKILAENPQAREELMSLLSGFCQRYGVELNTQDATQVDNDEVRGYILGAPSLGSQPALGRQPNIGALRPGGGVALIYDVTGSGTSRTFWI